MKIGLISDSHGNLPFVKRAGQYLKQIAKVDLIIHLGDEDDDADVLENLGVEILKVPGVFSSHYQDSSVPNRIVKEINGLKILITHSMEPHLNDLPEDKKPGDIIKEQKVRAVFYGHTHVPGVEEKNGVLWVNPGHLREFDKKGNPASFAVIEIAAGRISARIIKYSEI